MLNSERVRRCVKVVYKGLFALVCYRSGVLDGCSVKEVFRAVKVRVLLLLADLLVALLVLLV